MEILDGGNTNLQINEWRSESCDTAADALKRRFVNLQVLVPRTGLTSDVDDLLNEHQGGKRRRFLAPAI